MPVLIVDNNGGSTSIEDGTIQIGDLQIMTSVYKNNVSLTPIPPQNVIIKRNSFYFTKDQLIALLNHYKEHPELDTIEIALGVQVQGSKVDCPTVPILIDNSDCLGVIISMTNINTREPSNNIGDFVLINGYKSSPKFIDVVMCCPGSKPPPPPII